MLRLLSVLFITSALLGAEVTLTQPCHTCEFESCLWNISVSKSRESIEFDWYKGIISHHTEKPKAQPLTCNVDREFNTDAGGYIRVTSKDGSQCDFNGVPGNCGVQFKFHPNANYPNGVIVKLDSSLHSVEHLSTLKVQCGDFVAPKFSSWLWNTKLGWKSDASGDGTYAETINTEIEPLPRP